MADTETLTEFQDAIARELGVSWGLMDWPSDDQGPHIYLDTLDVPYGSRGRGTGTAAMQALTDYADSVGKVVILTPEPDDRDRLVKFYKRFGFVENRGANRNLDLFRSPRGRFAEMVELDNELDRDVMYRLPRQTDNPAKKKPAAKKKAVKKTLYYRGTQTADSGKTVRGLLSYTPCLGAALIYSAVPGDPFASRQEFMSARFRPTSTVSAAMIDAAPSLVLGDGLELSLQVSMGTVLRLLKYDAPNGIDDAEVRRLFNYLHNRLTGKAPGGEFLYAILDEDGEPVEDDDYFQISPILNFRDYGYDSLEDADRFVADVFIFADAPAVQKVAKRLGYHTITYLDVFAGGQDAAQELFDIDVDQIDCVQFAYDLRGDEQPCHETVRTLPGTEVEVQWARPSAELVDMFRPAAEAVGNPGRARRMMNPRNY